MPTCSIVTLPFSTDPADYFDRIRHAPGAVLLDSGRPSAERGRFDLFSAWPLEQLVPEFQETGSGFLTRCRASLARLGGAQLPAGCELPFAGGLLGYLGYDFGRRLEPLPTGAVDDLHLPDARLGLYAWAVITDHQAGTTQLMCHPSMLDAERQRLLELFTKTAVTGKTSFRLTTGFKAE